MLSTITSFFENHFRSEAEENEEHTVQQLRLASAALMIELCRADQSIDESETRAIVDILRNTFGLEQTELDELVQLATEEAKDATSLYQFTSLMNDNFEYQEKMQLILNLWEVAYADGNIDRYEDHMIRKVSELLYISHTDFIFCKHKARDKAE